MSTRRGGQGPGASTLYRASSPMHVPPTGCIVYPCCSDSCNVSCPREKLLQKSLSSSIAVRSLSRDEGVFTLILSGVLKESKDVIGTQSESDIRKMLSL